MNFFERMNRSQRREFEKLPQDEKLRIVAAEVNNQVESTLQVEIVNSFYRGYLLAYKMLMENYIIPMEDLNDGDDEKIAELVYQMLKEIRTNYEKSASELAALSEEKGE